MSLTTQSMPTSFAPWSLMVPAKGSNASGPLPQNALPKTDAVSANTPIGKAAESSRDFTFSDFLDVVNPLQHIPVVSTVYRELTGDDIGSSARIAGGTLYGGVIGLAAGVINSIVDETSGQDVGEHIYSALTGSDKTQGAAQTASLTNPVEGPAENKTVSYATPSSYVNMAESATTNSLNAIDRPTSGPSSEQIAALNLARVQPMSGELADKLQAIPAGSNMNPANAMSNVASGMPINGNSITNLLAAKTISQEEILPVQPVQPVQRKLSGSSSKSFKLSDDVKRQLEMIGQSQREQEDKAQDQEVQQQAQQIAPSKEQNIAASLPLLQAAQASPLLKPTSQSQTQVAAYKNASTLAKPPGSSIEVSEAMMEALQKYDALLNGTKVN